MQAPLSYPGDHMKVLETQVEAGTVTFGHHLGKFMQLAVRAQKYGQLNLDTTKSIKDAAFFHMFFHTNLIHPVCSLVSEYLGVECSSGQSKLSGESKTSHPSSFAIVATYLDLEIHRAALTWHIDMPSFFNRKVGAANIWDGWLRLPHQMASCQEAASSPFDLFEFGYFDTDKLSEWKYEGSSVEFDAASMTQHSRVPGVRYRVTLRPLRSLRWHP